jgi:hypothetical protein
MKLADLLRLRGALLAALVLTLAGGQLVWMAESRHEASRNALRRAEEAYRQGNGRLRQAEQDEAALRSTIERFHALERRGVVGPEQRLEWVERLGAIQARLRLPALDYELRPRRPLEAGGGAAGDYRLGASAMLLRANLVHEEDLLQLLAGLHSEPSAIVRPTRCHLGRLAAGGEGLRAECEVELITVAPGGR